MTLRRFVLALPFVLALSGCATRDDPPPRAPDVDETAQAYNNDVRWGRYYEASAQLPPEQRSAFLKLLDDSARPYRFTSIDLMKATPNEDGSRVEMLVSLEYYQLPSVLEKKVQQRQLWRYDRKENRWFVDPDMSVLGGPPPSGGSQVPAAPERELK
jgi:hypothetical protein